jgi:hypothetical protein
MNQKTRIRRRNTMKATWTIKPLAFAIAAGLAFSAQAQEVPPPLDPDSAATATVDDTQFSVGNEVYNEGTQNTAGLAGSGNDSEGSLNGAAGNIGVNIAAGDHNQQANAAALATADESFIFGAATATVTLSQDQPGPNLVNNFSTANTATVGDSANNASGNVGINVAAGVFNQQKNDLATAVSGGYVATATNTTTQNSIGNTTNNNAVLVTSASTTIDFDTGNVTGTYTGISDQRGNQYPEIWTPGNHDGGQEPQFGHIDLDGEVLGAEDELGNGGALLFDEVGELILGGSVSGSIPLVSLQQAVVNNATVSGSLNGASGNVGINVAAGAGNQQANSLAIAAGCTSCSQ